MRVSVYGWSDTWSSCETKNPRPHALKMENLFMLDGLYYLLKGEQSVKDIFNLGKRHSKSLPFVTLLLEKCMKDEEKKWTGEWWQCRIEAEEVCGWKMEKLVQIIMWVN